MVVATGYRTPLLKALEMVEVLFHMALEGRRAGSVAFWLAKFSY